MMLTKGIVAIALVLACSAVHGSAPASLQNLQVEYRTTPLGIDVPQPRFSWQMDATAGERGVAQAAYQIEVRDPKGAVVWDSKRTDSSESARHHVRRERRSRPPRRYAWTVTVWTQAGAKLTASSWFETGLMDPVARPRRPGAARQWIGGGNDDLVLYSPYLADLRREVRRGDRPGQHARELRLRRQRLAADGQVQEHLPGRRARKDQSYIKLELDISALGGSPDGKAKLHVYRAGYKDTDNSVAAAARRSTSTAR